MERNHDNPWAAVEPEQRSAPTVPQQRWGEVTMSFALQEQLCSFTFVITSSLKASEWTKGMRDELVHTLVCDVSLALQGKLTFYEGPPTTIVGQMQNWNLEEVREKGLERLREAFPGGQILTFDVLVPARVISVVKVFRAVKLFMLSRAGRVESLRRPDRRDDRAAAACVFVEMRTAELSERGFSLYLRPSGNTPAFVIISCFAFGDRICSDRLAAGGSLSDWYPPIGAGGSFRWDREEWEHVPVTFATPFAPGSLPVLRFDLEILLGDSRPPFLTRGTFIVEPPSSLDGSIPIQSFAEADKWCIEFLEKRVNIENRAFVPPNPTAHVLPSD